MKMPSMMLYMEEAVIATMAGMAYCMSSLPTGFSPNTLNFSV